MPLYRCVDVHGPDYVIGKEVSPKTIRKKSHVKLEQGKSLWCKHPLGV